MATLALEKYEGLGNDFLVLIDNDRKVRFDEALALALCDRHLGVGADGLIRLSTDGLETGIRMELRNAAGPVAETSGNGLRCAALAAVRAGLVHGTQLLIETLAGASRAWVTLTGSATAVVAVEMGTLSVGEELPTPLAHHRAFRVDAGNPHLVLIGSTPESVDLTTLGPELEAATPGGVNVELVVLRAGGDLDLTVWERGVGITLACGSGSCAAAAAAHFAGLTASRVVVHNPGGSLEVELSGEDLARQEAMLIGPARRVADVKVDLADFAMLETAGA